MTVDFYSTLLFIQNMYKRFKPKLFFVKNFKNKYVNYRSRLTGAATTTTNASS